MLEPIQKKIPTPCPKTKKNPQQDGRRGTIMIQSNLIPTKWVIHKLVNNNTKEVLPLLWRFWTPLSGFPAHRSRKGTGNPQEIWPWRPVEFDYRTSTGLGQTETIVLEGTNKILHKPRPRGKEQWRHRRLNPNYLLVLEGPLWRCRSAGAHHRDGNTGNRSPGSSPLV